MNEHNKLITAWAAAEAQSLAEAINTHLDIAGRNNADPRVQQSVYEAQRLSDGMTFAWMSATDREHLTLTDAMVEIKQYLADNIPALEAALLSVGVIAHMSDG